MYSLRVKPLPNIEKAMDDLISKPFIILKDEGLARRMGYHLGALRKEKILTIANDRLSKETIMVLRKNNFYQPGSVTKVKGKRLIYEFDNLFPPIF